MGDSLTHKFLMTIFAAAAVAGMIQFYRHVVVRSIYETSDAGFMEMDKARVKPTPVPGPYK
jgi:hypothetical protein